MILITRPKEDATDLARDITKLNLDVHTDSIIKINYKRPKLEFDKQPVILIASLNAVKSLKLLNPAQRKKLGQIKFIVIGKRVSDGLKMIGINKILFTCRDSEHLIQKISKNKTNLKISYFCSNNFNKKLVNQLLRENCELLICNTYSAHRKKNLLEKTCKLLIQRKIKVIIFFSIYTADSFFFLMKESKIDSSLLNSVHFLCLSSNIATVVKKQKYQHVYWPKLPTKKSLLISLKKMVKNQ